MESIVQHFPRFFVGSIALVFIFFGVLGLINPVGTVGPLEITINSAQAKTEIRATYGGLMLGIGLFLVFAAYDINMTRFGLIAIATILLLIGLTRLYGIVVDQTQAGLQWRLLALELMPAGIAVVLILFYSKT